MSKALPALVCACCLSWVQPASAHEFWLQPSTYRPAPGQDVSVDVIVGDYPEGIRALLANDDIVKFVAHGPAGRAPVTAKVGDGQVGKSPIGKITFSKPGPYILEFTDLVHFIQIDAVAYEGYLKKKGLDRPIAVRKQQGDSDKPGREAWSHFLKMIVVAGDHSREIRDRALGLKLEVICESRLDPRRPDDTLSFKVLYQGAPLKGVLVTASRRNAKDRLFMRTDANGRVEFKLKDPDVWMIDTVHIIDAPSDLRVTTVAALGPQGPAQAPRWQSFWTSLTFELSPRQ
jgi:uncharacterized GH25 family protein